MVIQHKYECFAHTESTLFKDMQLERSVVQDVGWVARYAKAPPNLGQKGLSLESRSGSIKSTS